MKEAIDRGRRREMWNIKLATMLDGYSLGSIHDGRTSAKGATPDQQSTEKGPGLG
jgi:hypothetical protein